MELPGLAAASPVTSKARTVLDAAAAELPADLGAQLLQALDVVARVEEFDELRQRVERLEGTSKWQALRPESPGLNARSVRPCCMSSSVREKPMLPLSDELRPELTRGRHAAPSFICQKHT